MVLIKNETIRIETLSLDSITVQYLETLNDSEYMKYSRHARSKATLDTQMNYLSQFDNLNSWILKITNLSDNSFVGTTNFYVDFDAKKIYFGFLIFRDFQGRGFASQVLRLLVQYCNIEFPRFKLVIKTDLANERMQRVAKSSGFQPMGEVSNVSQDTRGFFRDVPEVQESAEPKIPGLIKSAHYIGVVAHDAGGAEQLAWLLKELNCRIGAYLQGPAITIFEECGVLFEKIDSLNQLQKCDLVLTGSGWMSSLENEAIAESRSSGIPCLTVLDHWVNYQERFERVPKVIPQMLIVTNTLALAMANREFPDASVWLIPDFQIECYRRKMEYQVVRDRVLVLLEPTPVLASQFMIYGNERLELVSAAIKLNSNRNLGGVIVRLHPSQSYHENEFESMKSVYPEIQFSKSPQLIDDLLISSVVLGFSTYGLYIAAKCGILTQSYFKTAIGHWTGEITEISAFEDS